MQKYIWYNPELNEIAIAHKEDAFVFKNEYGEFHCYYEFKTFKLIDFYLIGEL